MRLPAVIVLAMIAVLAMWVWRSQLFVVSRPGDSPQPLGLLPLAERQAVELDVTLPDARGGAQHLRNAGRILLIHYWAPWEHDALSQARGLDSLRLTSDFSQLDAALVCFDPFPSVARFVGRHRLRVPVLFDAEHHLSERLSCPSVPYTYVVDHGGRVAIAQAGRVDWFAPGTRAALIELIGPDTLLQGADSTRRIL